MSLSFYRNGGVLPGSIGGIALQTRSDDFFARAARGPELIVDNPPLAKNPGAWPNRVNPDNLSSSEAARTHDKLKSVALLPHAISGPPLQF
jgi:hypothetical protein